MAIDNDTQRTPWPKFCRHCGTQLPHGQPRYCIECGGNVAPYDAPALPPSPQPTPVIRSTGLPAHTRSPKGRVAPTVRLGNAGVEQSVIGGTVQLPTSGAIPPGLWVLDESPGPDSVLAIYAPLRAVVGGWSGLIGKGWHADGTSDQPDGRAIFHFSANVEWFPAAGCGGGLRLRARIGAESRGKEGRERRGFRYLAHHDAPMNVHSAIWHQADGTPRPDLPIPQLQVMAPPRIPRISDYDDQIANMSAAEAELWAKGSHTSGIYRISGVNPTVTPAQAQTPAGRGITLTPVGRFEKQLRGIIPQGLIDFGAGDRFRVRIGNPYTCELVTWSQQLKQIRTEAHNLGIPMEAEPAAEWWLDRNGYDGVIFTKAKARYNADHAVIAFRRSQLVRVTS